MGELDATQSPRRRMLVAGAWWSTLALALACAAAVEQAHLEPIRSAIAEMRRTVESRGWDVGFWIVGDLGSGATLPLLLAALFVVTGSRRKLQDVAVALVFAGVVANVVKLLVLRERPMRGDDLSWPSGHTAAIAAFASAISGWRPAFTRWSWVAAACVGISRVVRARHWPVDVLGGLFVGALCGALARRLPLWLPERIEKESARLWVAWGALCVWAACLLLEPARREVELLVNAAPAVVCGLWAVSRTNGAPLRADCVRTARLLSFLLFVAVFAISVAGAAHVPLLDVDEPRFAAASRTMLRTGDWIVPWFNGAHRYDKPALVYWLQAACMAFLGEGEVAARLPSALGVSCAAVATSSLARQFGAPLGAALLAGFVAGTAGLVQGLAHGATADALLYGIVTATAVVQVQRHRLGSSDLSWWLMWSGIGLAFLAKGPPAIVGPAALGLGLVWAGARPRWSSIAAGVAWSASIVAAWAVPALIVTDGGFFTRGVMHHVVERSMRPFEGHGGFAPWWYLTYLVSIPLTMLPWGVFVPWAFPVLRGRQRPQPAVFAAGEPALDGVATARILGGWIAGIVGVFTLVVSKLPHYVMPCFPAIAVAIVLGRPAAGASSRWLPWALRALGTVLAVGLPIGMQSAGMTKATGPAVVVGAVLAVGCWLSANWFARGYPREAMWGMACATGIGMAALFGRALPLASAQALASRFDGELRAAVLPGERVSVYQFVAPSVTYYLDAVTPEVKGAEQALALLAEPGQLVLMRAHERDNLVAVARSFAKDDSGIAARAEAALAQPLWTGVGFHPTKGKVIEVRLYGTRSSASPVR